MSSLCFITIPMIYLKIKKKLLFRLREFSIKDSPYIYFYFVTKLLFIAEIIWL